MLVQNKMFYRSTVQHLRGLLDMLLEIPESFRGTPMIEIGSFIGESARIFSLFFSPVYSVDPLLPSRGVKNVRGIFTKTTLGRTILNIPKLSGEAVGEVPGEVSLVYIDGCHRYQAVVDDIRNYLPKIRKGGYIGGHDYGNKGEEIQVQKAGTEVLGNPDMTFMDNSWLKRVV